MFELRNVALEPGVRPSGRCARDVGAAVQRCAQWHGCPTVTLLRADPPGFGSMLAECFVREIHAS